MRKLALAGAAALALAQPAEAHVAGCHTRKCDRRVHERRREEFPSRHPERYSCERRPRIPGWTCSPASWYGPGFYGHGMACGGELAPGTVAVANKELPCGTRLRLCSSRCTTVTVRDRGPYVAGRVFDLTAGAKSATGFGSTGLVRWRAL